MFIYVYVLYMTYQSTYIYVMMIIIYSNIVNNNYNNNNNNNNKNMQINRCRLRNTNKQR